MLLVLAAGIGAALAAQVASDTGVAAREAAWAARPVAKPSKGRLIVYVHGFGGEADLEAGFPGDFAAIQGVFRRFEGESKAPTDELVFRFDTRKELNEKAAQSLNMQLLEKGAQDYREVVFVTLSNGGLVYREALLQATGVGPNGVATPPSPILAAVYRRASAHQVSPILGGAAEARGVTPESLVRYGELDPAGERMRWLFSEGVSKRFEETAGPRNHTYLICGDPFLRGIWSPIEKNPAYMLAHRLSVFLKDLEWQDVGRQWFENYERGRASGRDRHVEYLPPGNADFAGCYPQTYAMFNIRQASEKAKEGEDLLKARLAERRALGREAEPYYQETLRADPREFFLEEARRAFPPGDSRIGLLIEGLCVSSDTLPRPGNAEDLGMEGADSPGDLLERHTSLAFYKPLIRRMGEDVYGSDFQAWFDRTYYQH